MTKSELIEQVSASYPDISKKQVEFIVNSIFLSIKEAVKNGDKVEIRGFGSFKIREKSSKMGRNPKTGLEVQVPEKKIPYFKPGKEIKDVLVNS